MRHSEGKREMVDHLVKTFFPDFKIYTRDFVATVDREGQNCSKPITEQKRLRVGGFLF